MNIIFLDIDGVLNSEIGGLDYPEQYPMRQLTRIIEECNAYIVISSTWRRLQIYNSVEKISQLFKPYRLGERVIGLTPDFDMSNRQDEIKAYIDNADHKITNFVILDDDKFKLEELGNFIRTDCRYGLTKIDAERAIEILKKPSKANRPQGKVIREDFTRDDRPYTNKCGGAGLCGYDDFGRCDAPYGICRPT